MPIKGDGGGEHWTRTKGWRMPMMYVVENTGGNLSRHRRLVGAISSLSFLSLSIYIYILSFLSSQWKKKIKISNIINPKTSKKKKTRREKEKGRQKIPRTFKFKQNQENPRNERAQWVVGIVSTTTTKSSSKQNPVSSAAQKALFKTPPSFFGIRKSRRYPLLLLPSVTRALSGYTAD